MIRILSQGKEINGIVLLPFEKERSLTVTYKIVQSALVIRTTFVPLCFSEGNVLITSGTYECFYNQRNYLVFWKFVLMADVLIARVSYDILITRVFITRVDCIELFSGCE